MSNDRLKTAEYRDWLKAIKHNWSCNVQTHQIESGLYDREGKAVTNFAHALPAPQSDLAQQLIEPTIGILPCKSRDRVVVRITPFQTAREVA